MVEEYKWEEEEMLNYAGGAKQLMGDRTDIPEQEIHVQPKEQYSG